jgi:outer membrane protein TolC
MMKKNAITTTLWSLALALSGPTVLHGQEPAAARPVSLLDRYEVGRAAPPLDEGQSLAPMTLDEAIARALEQNLDIQSARLTPQMQSYSLLAAHAAFRPTFSATYGYNNSASQSTSQLDGGARTTSQRNTFNASLTQALPWYGARLSTTFNNSRTATDNSFSTRNPSYSSSVNFSYTQPLLSGFTTDNQRTSLRVQEILSLVTDVQLLSQIENISYQVRVAYWNLRATIEQIEIQRRSLAQAQQLLANNRMRVDLGTLAQIEMFQAEAQVASAEQALLNAEIQWRNQELAFKSLLVSGSADPLFVQTVNPTDLPTFEQQPVDIGAAVARALLDRTDIQQQRQQRMISDLNLEVTKQDTRPDLNMTFGYALQGVGGNLFDRSGLGGAAELVQEGGYSDALRSIADFETPTWSVTLNFSYPLGTNAAKANTARAELQLQQADIALESQELAITTEVTNAGLAVGNTFLQLEAARRTREAAEGTTTAELRKFDVGASTNFQVVSVQNTLTSARLSELRAVINYVNAIAEFDRVQRVGR